MIEIKTAEQRIDHDKASQGTVSMSLQMYDAVHAEIKELRELLGNMHKLNLAQEAANKRLYGQVADLQEALDNLAPYREVPEHTETMTNSVIEDRVLVHKMLREVSKLERLNDAVGHTPSRREIDSHIVDIRKVLRR